MIETTSTRIVAQHELVMDKIKTMLDLIYNILSAHPLDKSKSHSVKLEDAMYFVQLNSLPRT